MRPPQPTTQTRRRRATRFACAFLAVLFLLALGSMAWAQRGRFREGRGFGVRFPPAEFEDGAFAFCKVMFTSVRSEPMGMGWWTDYPFAGINLMTRFSELTTAAVSKDTQGEPNHWVVRLTDDTLFRCPFVMASDVGTIGLSNEEVQRLRMYLLKGGFLWVDDFWGSAAWTQWEQEISRVLPPSEYPVVELPLDHPVFRSLFHVVQVPQITNIMFWRWVGGGSTSERGEDSAEVHFRAIVDPDGHIMVVMTHNTDVGDSWEREGEDKEYFHRFSPDGYALGIDVLLYAMTH